MPDIEYLELQGQSARPYLSELASLRIRIFRDFPYLYAGSLAYEERYLDRYFAQADSFFALARDRNTESIVGASTAMPLVFEDEALRAPFEENGLAPERVMYFGESILLKDYRGLGIGKAFFEKRLAHARRCDGITHAAFCAVIRSPDHPSRPHNYRPLDGLWQSFGFHPEPHMIGSLSWLEIDEPSESPKAMQFWIKSLSPEITAAPKKG